MIFSDGNGLINPITGEIVNWIEQFSVWTPRALFTLETPDQWGYREQILDEADFLIMPANEAGLTFLAEQINTGAWQPYPKPSDSFSTAFPEYLSERPRRWLERHAPDATVLTELLKQVRDFLGETGYYWFKACAVYPELRWQLTLYLGYQLKLVTEERLAKLARLPWFRYGYMPNWLRERLVNDLYEQKEVRTTLYKLFLTALSNEPLPDFHLEIAFNKKIARHLLLKWFKHTPKNSPLSDYVFLAFMADKLAIRLPNTLYNRLTKPSNQLKPSTISFRPFLLAALLFALFAVTYEQLKQNFSRLFEQVSKDDNYIPNKIAENNMLRGIEYMRLQQDDRALKLLKEAVKLDRHYAEAHNALAVFYERRLRDYEKAKQHYQMALALKPNGSDNHNNYGQFLCGRNRWEEAEKHFLKALENPLYKTPEIPLTNAGLCALRNKHPIKGETYLRQALQRLPNIPIALYYMAQLSYEQKRYMPAREYLQRYLEVAKHTPQTLWLGIRIERALNNRDTEASYALLLRKRFPDAVETLLLNQTEVSKREQDASEQPVYHIVEPSDTLSSIAVRYGQDYKKIARWNNISLPYALSVGQKLRVSPPAPDSDGIPDEDDVCPYNTSEEISKGVYQTGSRKGCPIDSDNDGVPDYLDDCPQNTSLEISKSVDSRGCPFNELDTKYLRELVQVIESVRDVQETAKEQFKSVLEKLSAVVYFDGGELRQKYDQLSMELEHTEFKAAAIRDRIYLVENVAKALFGKWKNELNKHSNEKMRQASRRKLAKTQLQYEKFIATMKRAKQKIEPVLTLFREQVMFLKHNLNAQAIASIQGEFTLVESNVASLIKKMEESIQEADTFIRSMTQE
jgi:type IV pilus assembly protein PilF